MKYLFLDMEWNQLNNQFNISEDEILEISAICADEDFKNKKTFFSIVKPEHIEYVNKRTLTFLKLGESVLASSSPIEEVIHKFNKAFPKFNIMVVWNRGTYDLFINAIRQNGITLPRHKVIVLQELLTVIDNFMGFEKAMKRYKVNTIESYYIALNTMYITLRNCFAQRNFYMNINARVIGTIHQYG